MSHQLTVATKRCPRVMSGRITRCKPEGYEKYKVSKHRSTRRKTNKAGAKSQEVSEEVSDTRLTGDKGVTNRYFIDEYVPRERPAFLDEVRPGYLDDETLGRFDIDWDMIEVTKRHRTGDLQRKIQLYNADPTPELKAEIINSEYIADTGLYYLFTFAADHGDINDFDILMKNYGQTKAMKAACKHDRHDVFDHLIALGVVPTSYDLGYSNGSVRQTLLKMGITDVDTFWYACSEGNENEFHQLILNGSDINARPQFCGRTPLGVAIDRCVIHNIQPRQDIIVSTLLSLGAQ